MDMEPSEKFQGILCSMDDGFDAESYMVEDNVIYLLCGYHMNKHRHLTPG